MMHRSDKLPRKGRLYSVGKIDGKTRILDLGFAVRFTIGEFPNVKRLQERGLFHDKHPYKRYSRYKPVFVVYHCIAFRFIRLFLFAKEVTDVPVIRINAPMPETKFRREQAVIIYPFVRLIAFVIVRLLPLCVFCCSPWQSTQSFTRFFG